MASVTQERGLGRLKGRGSGQRPGRWASRELLKGCAGLALLLGALSLAGCGATKSSPEAPSAPRTTEGLASDAAPGEPGPQTVAMEPIVDTSEAGTVLIPLIDGQCRLQTPGAETADRLAATFTSMATTIRAYSFAPCGEAKPTGRVYVGAEPVADVNAYLSDFGELLRTRNNVDLLLAEAFGTGEATLIFREMLRTDYNPEGQRYTVTYLAQVQNRPAQVLISHSARVLDGRGVVYLHADPVAPGSSRDDILLSLLPAVRPHIDFSRALDAVNSPRPTS